MRVMVRVGMIVRERETVTKRGIEDVMVRGRVRVSVGVRTRKKGEGG